MYVEYHGHGINIPINAHFTVLYSLLEEYKSIQDVPLVIQTKYTD